MSETQAEKISDENDIENVEEVSTEQSEESTENQVIDEEVIVSIGEETPPSEDEQQAQAAPWITELRKNMREEKKKNKQLEERLKAIESVSEAQIELGKKPTLEDDDISFDPEIYEQKLSAWFDRKRLADDQATKIREQQATDEKAWQEKLNSYGEAKANLKVADYEDAELIAQELLSKTQQGILLQGAENPALIVYALGKNPAKAKELAAIKDPVKYAFAVAKLETQLKVTKRNAPSPEKTFTKGSGSISGTVDSTLERLRSDAAKTGNYTKVIQYNAAKREAKNK
jgi:hypothetical protein